MIKASCRGKESSLSSRSVYICAVSSDHYVVGENVTCFLYNINSYDMGIQMHRNSNSSESPSEVSLVVVQSLRPCPTLCNSKDYSTPGSSVLHYLSEFAQMHVH